MALPVIPATQEGEAGEFPETRRWRLQWAKITPLYSSQGTEPDPIKTKQKSVSKKISFGYLSISEFLAGCQLLDNHSAKMQSEKLLTLGPLLTGLQEQSCMQTLQQHNWWTGGTWVLATEILVRFDYQKKAGLPVLNANDTDVYNC